MRSHRLVRVCALAILPTLVSAGPAHAYAPESTPDRALQGAMFDAARHPTASGATSSFLVLRGGRPVVGKDVARPLIPASLMKLATTTAAIYRFGPDHRFLTRVRAAGGTESAPAALYLIGGGDPTLATAAYRRVRFLPDSRDSSGRPAFASGSPTIEQLAARVAATGIRTVRGDLFADESLFDADRVPDGWPSRYFGYDAECGYASALTVNEDRTDLTRKYLHPQPALQAARELRRALADRGVRVTGSVRMGRAPASARPVANVASPPLSEIVDFINRYSANFQAEILFKALGAAYGGSGSYAGGERAVRAALTDMNVPVTGFEANGGSGLSRSDRVTIRTVAKILDAILTRPRLEAVRSSLPVAGGLGTLSNRLDRWPTRGNLRGKTGLLQGVRGMAGWVTSMDGTVTVYAGLYNEARNTYVMSTPLDLFALAAAFHPSV